MCLQYEVFFLSVRVSPELVSLSWTKGWLSTPTRVKSAKACCNGGYNHFQMTNREECVCVCVYLKMGERKKKIRRNYFTVEEGDIQTIYRKGREVKQIFL